MRDYDPQVDQYVESDPMGLQGGSYSTYAYVEGSPLNYVDPLGLWSIGDLLSEQCFNYTAGVSDAASFGLGRAVGSPVKATV